MLAVTRVSEIGIGIVSAGVVLAGTDLGGAQRRLAGLFADLTHRRCGGPAVAERRLYLHVGISRAAARTCEPDELRHSAIL
jgi:hypothetical protein